QLESLRSGPPPLATRSRTESLWTSEDRSGSQSGFSSNLLIRSPALTRRRRSLPNIRCPKTFQDLIPQSSIGRVFCGLLNTRAIADLGSIPKHGNSPNTVSPQKTPSHTASI